MDGLITDQAQRQLAQLPPPQIPAQQPGPNRGLMIVLALAAAALILLGSRHERGSSFGKS